MSIVLAIEEFELIVKASNLEELPSAMESTIAQTIRECMRMFVEHLPTNQPIVKTDRTCAKCHTTDPKRFNRKKTECTQCISKAAYEKIKIRLNTGKERNIQARLARKECSVCKLHVERHNAQMFDWDHRNPAEKRFAISKLNYKEDAPFFQEIAKCDLTCRNCHIMRTMAQFQNNEIPKRKPNATHSS